MASEFSFDRGNKSFLYVKTLGMGVGHCSFEGENLDTLHKGDTGRKLKFRGLKDLHVPAEEG